MMRLPDSDIELINTQLRDKYGLWESDKPLWRVVLADEQREKRHGEFEDYSKEGFFIRRVTETREVEKYPHCRGFYILERYMETESYRWQGIIDKHGYELVFRFMNAANEPLPPKFSVCYFVIESVYENAARTRGIKYEHPYADTKIQAEVRKAELDEIQEYLYGNETPTTDALAYGRGVTVPSTYVKSEGN
jgi:hypothetical protein